MQRRSGKSSPRAFTLVELIAIVIVLAVLAGVAGSRFWDHSARAKDSAEAATVAAVRGGISLFRMNAAVSNTSAYPTTLDSLPAGSVADPVNPFFTAVLTSPVVSGWSKTSNSLTYLSPSGKTYTYDPNNGTFLDSTDTAALTASGGYAGNLPSGYIGGPTPLSFTSATTFTAGTSSLSGITATGYALDPASGLLTLTDSSPSFSESARRVALAQGQAIQAGTYSLSLDTALTDYYTQLNYWHVLGIKNGTTIALSGNTLNYDINQAGVKSLFRDYAPPEKSNGNPYTYQSTFTVSAADAASYDQIVVAVAGSRLPNQVLTWQNIKLTRTGP